MTSAKSCGQTTASFLCKKQHFLQSVFLEVVDLEGGKGEGVFQIDSFRGTLTVGCLYVAGAETLILVTGA